MGSPDRPFDPASNSTTFDGPLLTIDGVAETLGVTRRHVQRLVTERRIPFLKIGRFVRFDPAELNVWLEDQRVQAVAHRTAAGTATR